MEPITDLETEAFTPTAEGDGGPIRVGQSITCEAGHIIATATSPCTPGEGDWMDKMDWKQDAPDEGAPATCEVCGRVWLFKYTWPAAHPPLVWRKVWICIDGEWSTPLTTAARAYLNSVPTMDS